MFTTWKILASAQFHMEAVQRLGWFFFVMFNFLLRSKVCFFIPRDLEISDAKTKKRPHTKGNPRLFQGNLG